MPSPPHETAAPGSQLERLLALAVEPDPVRTAVVHPVDELSLSGAVEAAVAHLIVPVLVGPQARIRKAAEGAGLDISDFEVVDAPHSHAAASAVEPISASTRPAGVLGTGSRRALSGSMSTPGRHAFLALAAAAL